MDQMFDSDYDSQTDGLLNSMAGNDSSNNYNYDFWNYLNFINTSNGNDNYNFYNYNFYTYYYYINMFYSKEFLEAKMRVENFMNFFRYFGPVMMCMSFVGNLLIILVVVPQKKKSSTLHIYLTSLALADLLVNCTSTLDRYLTMFNFVVPAYSTLDCKLRGIVPVASHFASVWSLAVASIDMVVSVLFSKCTPRFGKIIVAIIWTLALVFGIYQNVIYYLEDYGLVMVCQMYAQLETFHNIYRTVFQLLQLFIPFVLILVSIIFMVVNLILKKLKGPETASIDVMVTLIMLDAIYLVTLAPHQILSVPALSEFLSKNASVVDAVNLTLASGVAVFLVDLNSAIKFFAYFFGSSRFRNDLKGRFKSAWFSLARTLFTRD